LELPERLCRDLKSAIGDIQYLAKKWQTLNNFQVPVMLEEGVLKHTCVNVKQCEAKKYWGTTILSSQYLEKYWGECPYGVGTYAA